MPPVDNEEYEDLDNEQEMSEEEQEQLEDRGDNVEDEEEGDESEEDADESENDGDESEEDEEADESDVEDDEVEPKRNIKIPKYRLDQEIEKNKSLKERERWLEAQLEKLLAANQGVKNEVEQKATEVAFDFEVAEEQYISLIVEGDVKEAMKLRKQIDAEKTKAIKAELKRSSEETELRVQAQKESEKFETLITNYESKYPFFNQNSKKYNEEAVDTVNTLMAGFIAQGKSKAEALEKAVKKVLPLYHVESEDSKKSSKDRVVEQRKKNIKTIKGMPPAIKGKGAKQTEDFVDPNKMSEKEFAKLDARTKAKLRGDLL